MGSARPTRCRLPSPTRTPRSSPRVGHLAAQISRQPFLRHVVTHRVGIQSGRLPEREAPGGSCQVLLAALPVVAGRDCLPIRPSPPHPRRRRRSRTTSRVRPGHPRHAAAGLAAIDEQIHPPLKACSINTRAWPRRRGSRPIKRRAGTPRGWGSCAAGLARA